ncbi:MAG: alginate export family protein [Candidatus Thiodiazotropha lotti]|nr:alginate export family protein [Candidatus Thiodiazotropha lotti]MCW4219201.1 alginate export family protein [Candidatus Thiodiazotropha lotti]
MRRLLPYTIFTCLFHLSPATAENSGQLYSDIEIGIEFNVLDGLSLGTDDLNNKLLEQDREIEFDLEYRHDDQFSLFFTGALIDESEIIKNADIKTNHSGLEFREIGIAYLFGDVIDSELKLGRVEYESISHWWSWWDNELDLISLQMWYEDLEAFVAIAEQQVVESTDEDFIDPEMDEIQRLVLSMSWELFDGQILNFYYLKQNDNSSTHHIGDSEEFSRIDEEDADLTWQGLSYVADIEIELIGEIDLELHYAEIHGRSTLYEFEELSADVIEVSELKREDVDASASGYLLRWTPYVYDQLSLIIAGARGSGDANLDDRDNKSYRQTGLQGDFESYGELFQPELSNLKVDMIGLQWRFAEDMAVDLMRFDYKQEVLSDEIRNASIEVEPSGNSRHLGTELDLILSIEHEETLELFFTYAKFKPGRAFAEYPEKHLDFIGIDFVYKFH